MPDTIERNLTRLLDGNHLDELTSDLCDFTLADQNAATEAQGVQPSAPSDFQPQLGVSVNYIVACVMINEDGAILMMQEAKKSCAGKWYLPAGRMERGETIVEAGVREVFEETGLNVEITTLLGVECAGGSWFRFVVTGTVIGGELKTPARADKESLQAKWVHDLNELSLRANDIIPLIEMAKRYYQRLTGGSVWHTEMLPAKQQHTQNYLRLVIAIKKRSTNKVHVLVSERNSYHFPTVEIHPGRSVHSTLRKFMIELFGAELPQHRPDGILSVEHNAASGQHDGICLTVLVAFRPPLEEVSLIGKCIWHELSPELGQRLCAMLGSKHATLALHVVR